MRAFQKPFSDLIRLFQISWEFLRGFHFFGRSGAMVSFFGSARLPVTYPDYARAKDLAAMLGHAGFGILTGGGPSLMQAANEGAREAKAPSLACNIVLPHEQKSNPFVDRVMTMKFFFSRKYMLISYSYGFIFFPGGVGTLDELFEVLTLMQVGKLEKRPVFLVNTAYWFPMIQWMQNSLLKHGAIDHSTMELFKLTDDMNEIVEALKRTKEQVHAEGDQYPVNRKPQEAHPTESADQASDG